MKRISKAGVFVAGAGAAVLVGWWLYKRAAVEISSADPYVSTLFTLPRSIKVSQLLQTTSDMSLNIPVRIGVTLL